MALTADLTAWSEAEGGGSAVYLALTSLGADIDLASEAVCGFSPARPAKRIMYTGGALVVTRVDGTNVTLPAAWAGSVLPPIQAKAIVASGTTATAVFVGY